MARSSASVARQTAEDIVNSAATLFASRGFAHVSLSDVADAAGVTRGAIYHHYESKSGLFRAVTARAQEEVASAVLRAAEAAGASTRARLRAGCHAFLDTATSGSTARILLLDAPAVLGWAVWRELDAAASQVHLRAALSELGVSEQLLDALTVQLSGAMNEAALWLAEREDAGAREEAHAALGRLLYAVAGPE